MDPNRYNPILIEPGVKYFLDETLKNCKKKKNIYTNQKINLLLFCLFVIIIICILFYKYKTRPNKETKKKKKLLQRDYFITKIRKLQVKKAKELNKSITNLPKFESPFELLHKNFYES
tara:strand:+ start:448 stop:801 length:354 start_codon:yes stop_codon:yes gene_type:complete